MRYLWLLTAVLLVGWTRTAWADEVPGTKPLEAQGDLAARMVEGIDKYLMRALAASVEKRQAHWKPDYSSLEAYEKSLEPKRARLRRILGVVDPRIPFIDFELVGGVHVPAVIAHCDSFQVYNVRWPVLPGVTGEGVLLVPKGQPVADVIALPDAGWTPQSLAGVPSPPLPPSWCYARRLAANGCRVLVPGLIGRADTWSGNEKLGRLTNQPHREFIYRMAYEMGRHVLGYEVQKVLGAVDHWAKRESRPPLGVIGYGEGSLLALVSAALDPRIEAAVVSGYFGPHEDVWREPIDRNVWRLLTEFGDADLALMVPPRTLIIENSHPPNVEGPPPPRPGRTGAAPGTLLGRSADDVSREFARLRALYDPLEQRLASLLPADGNRRLGKVLLRPGDWAYGPVVSEETLEEFLYRLTGLKNWKRPGEAERLQDLLTLNWATRQRPQFEELVAYTQRLMREADTRREQFFWAKTDKSSLEKWQRSTQPLRDYFWEEVIGKLPAPTGPPNPRSRLAYDTPKWKGYEVTLDLYPDVFAYGILLVPKDLQPGERRAVVVCQHGLEGRPQDVVNPKERTRYYNSFGAQLADLGYVVYAPQNPYIGQDKFRVLQRKANPLGLSLFSFIVRQHERTLDWLAALPFVEPDKIAFYGLSYGGKTAMRVPAILPRYCLAICSGDFNEWIWKNVSVDFRGSYMFSGEYEMPEFDLGNTFNYAEMAGLIAPRPFMVERGHDDGVGIDEWVALEYAKVRRLYAKLGIPERTEIEFFDGGHVINGKGTFAFLKKHLGWPK
jgi:dienelactone hydrolase